MIYFDNAATGGTKPESVLSAVNAALKQCANPGRSGHTLSLQCAYTVEKARGALSDFFEGYGYERTVFTKNCTEALNLAIFSALKDGGHALTTCMEHNSVLRPLQHLKEFSVPFRSPDRFSTAMQRQGASVRSYTVYPALHRELRKASL